MSRIFAKLRRKRFEGIRRFRFRTFRKCESAFHCRFLEMLYVVRSLSWFHMIETLQISSWIWSTFIPRSTVRGPVSGPPKSPPLPAWEADPYAGLPPHADIFNRQGQPHCGNCGIATPTHCGSIRIRLYAPDFSRKVRQLQSAYRKRETSCRRSFSWSISRARAIAPGASWRTGRVSVSRGIVDVFFPLMRSPVRIEFFGDSVDSLREF